MGKKILILSTGLATKSVSMSISPYLCNASREKNNGKCNVQFTVDSNEDTCKENICKPKGSLIGGSMNLLACICMYVCTFSILIE